jgi:hypothetical protein
MGAFATQCPACRSRVKIESRRFIGKKARCPACGGIFQVRDPRAPEEDDLPVAEEVPKKKKGPRAPRGPQREPDVDFWDVLPSEEAPAEDEVEEAAPSRPAQAPRRPGPVSAAAPRAVKRGKSPSARSSKDSGSNDRLLRVGVIALGLLLVAGLGFLAVRFLPAVLQGRSRTAWLPKDTQIIVEFDPEEFWTARAMRPLRENKTGVQLRERFERALEPLKLADVDYLTIGYAASEGLGVPPVVVVYAHKPLDVATLQSGGGDFSERDHGGQRYFFSESRNRAAFLPEDRVLVYGLEDQILAAIDEGQNAAASGDLVSMPPRGTFVFAARSLPQADDSPLAEFPGVGLMGTSQLEITARQDIQSVGARVQMTDVVQAQSLLVFASADQAQELVDKTREQIAQQLAKLETERQEQLNTNPTFQLNVGGIKQFFTAQQQLLKSMRLSNSGATVEMEFEIPDFLIEQSVEMLSLMGMNLLPGGAGDEEAVEGAEGELDLPGDGEFVPGA